MLYNYVEAEIILDIKDVRLSLGGNLILDGVSLLVKNIKQEGAIRGQVRSLLGPSGIGKTQFMRILGGLSQPDSGSVLISHNQGKDLVPIEPGTVGIVAQDYPLFMHLTVLENLVLAAKLTGESPSQSRTRARELLQRFAVLDRENFWPSQLSGGQRQRVAIIQQILVNRTFLIMDEPFSGLDPRAVHEILSLINEISTAHEFNTILIITHDISSALQISDHIHVMGRQYDSAGKIVRGAHIIESLNLIDEGIAWRDKIRDMPRFHSLSNRLEDLFDMI